MAGETQWRDQPRSDLEKAARSGDHGAQWALGKLEGDRAASEAIKAFAWYQRAAEQSLPYAEHEVAIHYLGHLGWSPIPTKPAEGFIWMQRSADHGFEPAQHRLADLYLAGDILPPDLPKAIHYLEAAAAASCPQAQDALARHYLAGDGEPRSATNRPVALLQRAARNGQIASLTLLGDLYRTGLGVRKDFIRAIHCYEAAREAESKSRQTSRTHRLDILELLDENLEPTSQLTLDYVKFVQIVSLYRKATERSDAVAMTRLGELCLAGTLTAQSKVEAYRWFSRAAERGHAPAKKARDELRPNMNSEELSEAARQTEKSL